MQWMRKFTDQVFDKVSAKTYDVMDVRGEERVHETVQNWREG
eukprot:CAMPEP_0183831690 /NCGR_PEP_ID=MMETSP0807_2-20130328/4911_1 /TAXON_ID=88271 /ORGANISM="Picocystis salinarum, Strain CCMP1897" /LENGTH=41 /DNA_ID= /DNA_START= /DNA_END= /DNA_ORIENTATION=